MSTTEMFNQPFKHYLVLDFESTCQEGVRIDPQEIIEFPCLLVGADDLCLVDQFHEYVKPVGKPLLTDFCTGLTGITQDMIKDKDTFPDVLSRFVSWYKSHGLDPSNATFVTCGQWDLESMLPQQCLYSGLTLPQMLDVGTSGEFVNIKLTYQNTTGQYGKGIKDMQKHLGLQFEGRLHSGIDDCKNIFSVMKSLVARGAKLSNNGMTKKTKPQPAV